MVPKRDFSLKMDVDTKSHSSPWQPLTFGGVAAFAHGSFTRLFIAAFALAVLVAGSVVGLFYMAWEPALRRAIAQLPEPSAIRAGELQWTGPTPVKLAEGKFLSIVVDRAGTGELGFASDLQFELGRTEFRVRSLLGYVGIPYPTTWAVPLNRRDLEAWWGAWRPVVAAGLAVGVASGLFLFWGILGAVYALPVQLIAFYSDRHVSVFGAWRLAVASLMSGALLMGAAILAYSFQQLNLIQLALAWAVHLALGWLYVFMAPLCLPRRLAVAGLGRKSNPFRETSARRAR